MLLVIIPIAMLYRRKKRFDPVMAVPMGIRSVKSSIFLKIGKMLPVLKYVALAVMIVAMARPQWGTQQVDVSTEGVNIVMALDLSGSMAALDFKLKGKIVNRLDAIRSVAEEFISKRGNDRIALVVFGTNAYTQLPLTSDYNTIASILGKLQIGAAGDNTAIGDAIGISLKRLEDVKSKSNIIILLTDGQSNAGEISPEAAAEIAVQRKVKIYTIGVGTRGEAPFLVRHPILGDRYIYRKVDMDEKTLTDIAKKTGGLYFRAEDTEGLKKIYDTIDKLEKTEIKMKSFAEYKEFYQYFLLSAFVILCIWIILSNTRFLRVP
jgi:Ca-activated chloride channel family protein